MRLATEHRIHDIACAHEGNGGHVAHAALLALFTQAEAGVMCPINMTYASVPALRTQMDVARPWIEKLIGGRYDAPLRPLAEKAGVTIGMAMRSEEHTSELQSLMRISYAVFCLKKKKHSKTHYTNKQPEV